LLLLTAIDNDFLFLSFLSLSLHRVYNCESYYNWYIRGPHDGPYKKLIKTKWEKFILEARLMLAKKYHWSSSWMRDPFLEGKDERFVVKIQ